MRPMTVRFDEDDLDAAEAIAARGGPAVPDLLRAGLRAQIEAHGACVAPRPIDRVREAQRLLLDAEAALAAGERSLDEVLAEARVLAARGGMVEALRCAGVFMSLAKESGESRAHGSAR